MKKIELVVDEDALLRDYLKTKLSKKLYKRLRFFGKVYANNRIIENHQRVYKGDILSLIYEKKVKEEWIQYPYEPKILLETEHYLIVYKESDFLTIPTKAEPKSLFQSILYHYQAYHLDATVSFINRLDKETEGLVLVAKNAHVAYQLNANKGKIKRSYLALCNGHFASKKGIIHTFIDVKDKIRFVSTEGKEAITEYEVIEEYENGSLVRFNLYTGRTHQIRVHCQYLGHPIVGDKKYGFNEAGFLHLCSYSLEFYDEFQKKPIKIKIKPKWM